MKLIKMQLDINHTTIGNFFLSFQYEILKREDEKEEEMKLTVYYHTTYYGYCLKCKFIGILKANISLKVATESSEHFTPNIFEQKCLLPCCKVLKRVELKYSTLQERQCSHGKDILVKEWIKNSYSLLNTQENLVRALVKTQEIIKCKLCSPVTSVVETVVDLCFQ